jgi:GNAT superfamily N-acetyltransferase
VQIKSFENTEEYLSRVATAAAAAAWDDLQPRGLFLTVQSGPTKAARAMMAAREFSATLSEDVFDPQIGGVARGGFVPLAYDGLLQRSPDQLTFLIDPTPGSGTTPSRARVDGDLDVAWAPVPIAVPQSVDPEVWSEYGFPRAARTAVLSRGGSALGYGCLIPFHDHVLEAGLFVEEPHRGTGIGTAVALALFEDLSAHGCWCHWVTLAQNEASQRLARLGRSVCASTISTYLWT